ncbi:MAG: radical SAM protein [Thermodesulfobacteriota bacterium]
MNPYIIPIFISHQGCPQRCIFCNQPNITGQDISPITAKWVTSTIEEGLGRKRRAQRTETQVAFYGGTFTGLDTGLQEEILSVVLPFWEEKKVHSVRLSTRPDYINTEEITLLRKYPVKTVELGIQSMNDAVLARAQRGHTSRDNLRAVRMLKEAGFQVGAQIMIGLPGEDRGEILDTLEPLFAHKPDFMRVYPTLVLKGTVLAGLYQKGEYHPLTLEEAVEICRDISILGRERGIAVIRMGLQADAGLEKNLIAGPYHPAFGQIVKAEVFKNDLMKKLASFRGSDEVKIWIAPPALPLLTGFKKRVLDDLQKKSNIRSLKVFTDHSLGRGDFRVTRG